VLCALNHQINIAPFLNVDPVFTISELKIRPVLALPRVGGYQCLLNRIAKTTGTMRVFS
jgi:hypothetical protein